jgi:hypothetical protein
MMASAALETGCAAPPLGMSPGDGALAGCPGGGDAKSPVGISPAKTETESTTVKTNAVNNRFILIFSF